MMNSIVIAQLNFRVGAMADNVKKIIASLYTARDHYHADLIVFPELALSGYPPEDLLFRQEFKDSIEQAFRQIAQATHGIAVVLGHPHYIDQTIYNAASFIVEGKVIASYHKQLLPNYGLFDEQRYFTPGNTTQIICYKGVKIACLICEDMWQAQPAQTARKQGAELILCLNASPFELKKSEKRQAIIQQRSIENHCPIIYIHSVGAQDDFIFDGGSFVTNSAGQICLQAPFWCESLIDIAIDSTQKPLKLTAERTTQQAAPIETTEERIYHALILSLREYIDKNKSSGVLIGVSGGIDSALVLALAVDALGKERVTAVFLPSRYTDVLSQKIYQELIQALGLEQKIISIESSFRACLSSLNLDPENPPTSIVTENLQARCRAIFLMALSNQTGKLVLNTSNKSELAVGYCTLYGDAIGAFSVLKDVYKTLVFRLAHYRNTVQMLFPNELLQRAPSAELALKQKDEDKLPSYTILDAILQRFLEKNQSAVEIIQAGFDAKIVRQIIRWIEKNEYKRRQSPIGPRITSYAFHRERRYPISSEFFDSVVR